MDKFDNERAKELTSNLNNHNEAFNELFRKIHEAASMRRQQDLYDLDDLIETFSRHAADFDSEKDDRLRDWCKCNPGELTPDHFLETFNLSRALHSMAVEIRKLKEKESDNHAENATRGI